MALSERSIAAADCPAVRRDAARRSEMDQELRAHPCTKTRAARRWRGRRGTRRDVAFSKKKSNKVWIWKAYCRDSKQLIDWECGDRDQATLDRLLERLRDWHVLLFCTDNYGPYESALPVGKHYIGKDQTWQSEQNNSRQRHWFARFTRKSLVVSHSMLMIELTMRLFAAFHVNGSDAPLLERISSMIS